MRFTILGALAVLLLVPAAEVEASQRATDRTAAGQARQAQVTATAPRATSQRQATAPRTAAQGQAAARTTRQATTPGATTQRQAATPRTGLFRSAAAAPAGMPRTTGTCARRDAQGRCIRTTVARSARWQGGLPPMTMAQQDCPAGTVATLARGHSDVVRCLPI
jgi:hypothetical protein